jgi:hypothetical protein
VFVAGIEAAPFDDEGTRILDGMEEVHGFVNLNTPSSPTRLYQFTQFSDHAEAIAWLEAQALTFQRERRRTRPIRTPPLAPRR